MEPARRQFGQDWSASAGQETIALETAPRAIA
jgi:hypothetical protein